jgi:hypothetical protein
MTRQNVYYPPAKNVGEDKQNRHGNGYGGNQGPMQKQNFRARTNENDAVVENQPAKMRLGNFAYALLLELPLVAARNHKFREPLSADDNQQRKISVGHGH